ncbi:MAG: hydroxysqualene dehydroxylase HpnE [Elusimicrobiota bacterium]|jgi:squalene-associated FAD-dependent desaturase
MVGPTSLVAVPIMTTITKNVLIIGGGFAGLSAATSLAERGFHVTVLEGRQVLGGRAYSFADPKMSDAVDNGQHLFMGCYRETLAFLERIGTRDLLTFQPNLSVDFYGDGGRHARLSCWPLPSPWHLLSGLLRLSTLSWKDRWNLRYLRKALKDGVRNPQGLDDVTVDEWLIRARQSERARRHLWDLLAIAALNEGPSIASAAPFVAVLSQAFFDRRKASRLGLSSVGLSDLYATSSKRFIEAHGGHVKVQSPVAQLVCSNRGVTGVLLRDGRRFQADWVIAAVSAGAFSKLIPEKIKKREPVFQRIENLHFSPIISIHLWFDRPISRSLFAGLLDTHIQWFFNKARILRKTTSGEGYISLVISGAHCFEEWPERKLLTLALEELRRLFPEAREAVLMRSLVIQERQATLSPTVGSERLRPEFQSPLPHFLIAGDWTRTGLPATIESACLSGHRCADLVAAQGISNTPEQREIVFV